MSLRHIIDLVESEQFLFEHIVTNPEEVDAFVNGFAKDVTPEAGKAWFKKTLRKAIFNDDTILSYMNPDALSTKEIEALPDYARRGIEDGENVFAFVPENPDIDDLAQRLAHIVDWFNSLHEIATREPTNAIEKEDAVISSRMLGKLLKMNLEQIEKVSEEWFARMGSRVSKTKSIEGGEILHEWPNGFYAIRYTSKTTMMQDGQDLQNCLRSGTYWSAVADGSQMVVGIRKPNDEAVVGMRIYVREKKLAEAKGKNNKPVSSDYISYVVDLINKLNVDASGNEDLKNSGIVMHNGRAGSFDELAELVYDDGGVKLWKAGNQFRGSVGNTVVDGSWRYAGLVGSILVDAIDMRHPGAVPQVLNAFKASADAPVDVTRSILDRLENVGVFDSNGRFGTIAEVGTPAGSAKTHDLYTLETNGETFVFAVGKTDASIVKFELGDNGYIVHMTNDRGVDDVAEILNASGRRPSFAFERQALFDRQVFFNGEKYGPIEEVGKEFAREGDVTIYTLRKARVWIAKSADDDFAMFRLAGASHRFDAVAHHGRNTPRMLRAARAIIEYYQPEDLPNPERFGVVTLPNQIVTNRKDFFKQAQVIERFFRGETDDQFGDGDERSSGSMRGQVLSFLAAESEKAPFTREEAEKILDMVGVGEKTLMVNRYDTAKVYDLTVNRYDIHFPWARVFAKDHLPIEMTDDLVTRDLRRAMIDAKEMVERNPGIYRLVGMTFGYASMLGLEDEIRALRRVVAQTEQDLQDKTSERLANPEKYATDLSSRFAAMNAKRKLT